MAFRAFGYQTIGASNTAQPFFSTTLSAAIVAQSDPQREQIIPVSASAGFVVGDWLIIDTGTNEERVLIGRIPDSTHIALAPNNGCFKSHAISVLVRLSALVSTVFVQLKDGGSAPVFIGATKDAKTDGTLCRAKLQNMSGGVQPVEWRDSYASGAGAGPIDIGEIWIVGTNPDQYLPSFGSI